MRKTKMICTIGPASQSEEKVREIILAGMNVARCNFSHGDHEEQGRKFDTIRKVSRELNMPVAILRDTKGPVSYTHLQKGNASLPEASEQRGQLCLPGEGGYRRNPGD